MKSIEIDSGGPVMPRSKSRATVRSLVSVGSSRWPMPGGRDARLGEPVVEPGGGAIAEVGADGLVDRRQDLQQDEHDADDGQRAGQRLAALHRADERAHRDRERGRQDPAQQRARPTRRAASGRRPSAGRRRTSTRCARAGPAWPQSSGHAQIGILRNWDQSSPNHRASSMRGPSGELDNGVRRARWTSGLRE